MRSGTSRADESPEGRGLQLVTSGWTAVFASFLSSQACCRGNGLSGRKEKGKKGTGYFSGSFLGWPRGRRVDSRPSVWAMRRTHLSLPNGLPRERHRRKAANSASVCGRLTVSSQSSGRSRSSGSGGGETGTGSVFGACPPFAYGYGAAEHPLREVGLAPVSIGKRRLKESVAVPGARCALWRVYTRRQGEA